MLSLTYNNLISFGIHVGHTFQNTLFMSAWMLFSIRQNIWIINLFKTIYMFRIGFKCLKDVVFKGGPIWFINLDRTMERYVSFNANRAGEFFLCNYWPKGIVSNFKEVQKSFRKFRLLSVLNMKIRKSRFFRNIFENSWLFTRFSWPRFLFVSNVLSCPSSVSEALNLGIFCLAIVDTNVMSNAITIPVPGNDESLHSIIFYNELVCNYILLCKFKSIILWFTNVRNYKRLRNLNNNNNMFSDKEVSEQQHYKLLLDSNNIFFTSLRFSFNSDLALTNSNMQSLLYKASFDYPFLNLKDLLSQNFRLFFLISRWYCFKHSVRRKVFFSGLLKSWKWRKKKFRFLFWKRRLKKILTKNIKFGFTTLQYLWRFVNRKTFKKYLKNDLWFSRIWSSYFLNYMSLFYQVYSGVDVSVDYLFILGIYRRYLKKVPWVFGFRYFNLLTKLKKIFGNRYSRFLNCLNFTVFFFLFKSSLLYYLSFPLKKSMDLNLQKGSIYLDKLSFLKFVDKRVFKAKKKYNKKNIFSLGFWSFDKIISSFYWKKIDYVTLPLRLKFFFKYILKSDMVVDLIEVYCFSERFYLKKLKYINYDKTRFDIF